MFGIMNLKTKQLLGIQTAATDDGEVFYELNTFSDFKFVVSESYRNLLNRIVSGDYEGLGSSMSPYLSYSLIDHRDLRIVELGVKWCG